LFGEPGADSRAAQVKGHNPEVFEAMVDADLGLTIDGKEITPKGKLLTLTNKRRLASMDTHLPAVVRRHRKVLDELLQKIGLSEPSR